VNEQADIEIVKVVRSPNQTDDQFDEFKKNARGKAFRITVTINGRGGESLFGDDIGIFQSANRPEQIDLVYFTNITGYQSFANVKPVNSFELNLDFSKPALLDVNTPISSPTRNLSRLTIKGDRDSWVGSISDVVLSVIERRRTGVNWLHRGFIYDLGLWALGFPFGMYLCWKASPFISRYVETTHGFLSGAAYVYIVILAANAYRILFGYTKWAFPVVELVDNRDAAGRHRSIWALIVVGLLVDVVWEVFTHIR
jgi:hypothetical protein